MPVKSLKMECSKCRVAQTCPRSGSSPLRVTGRPPEYCQIVGGYGREPIDRAKLSAASIEQMEKDGPCLTLAYVPLFDDLTKQVRHELTKVFAQPVLHPRESVPWNIEGMYPKSHKA